MFQLPSFVARWTQRIHESIFENGREITFLIKLEFPIIAAIVHCLLLKPGDIPWNIISWSRDASLERNMIFVTRISRDPSIPWILSWILGHLRSIYIISILEENYIKFDSFDFLFLHYIYKKKKKKCIIKLFPLSIFLLNIFYSCLNTLFTEASMFGIST